MTELCGVKHKNMKAIGKCAVCGGEIIQIGNGNTFCEDCSDKNFGERLQALANRKECQQAHDRWIDANEAQPLFVENEDYSPNVLAICNGELMVMCYCYNPSEDDAERGFFWANCNGNIDGEAEFDDEYDVTFWQYLPSIEGFVA
jgi:hypothetical protein